jgi:hypothetical protein
MHKFDIDKDNFIEIKKEKNIFYITIKIKENKKHTSLTIKLKEGEYDNFITKLVSEKAS